MSSPYNVNAIENPTQQELRNLALEFTPAVMRSGVGNLNKLTRNKARKAKFTYVVAPDSEKGNYSAKTMPREKVQPYIDRQRKYIEEQGELIQIDGYLGLGDHAHPVQWLYTKEAANIAGMQQILSFPRSAVETPEQLKQPFDALFRIIYTPHCFAEGLPGNQAIIVDLESWTTHIMGPDYFGESKKAALRMLNEYVYRKGGLVLHAGAKAVTLGGKSLTMTVMGLSGTGKTTTSFSKQGELTRPIQDDMVCIWPNGVVSITENGCFAKTFGLTEETEPVIYHGTLSPEAWVENAFMNGDGSYDFSKQGLSSADVKRLKDVLIETGADAKNVNAYIDGTVKYDDVVDELGIPKDGWDFVVWTQNGRSIIPMSSIKDAVDLTSIPTVRSMGILNRDEGADAATPGILRFASPEQAAGYFMLGETTKTSAAGKERGKTRSPFTQPFFPGRAGRQATRFSELVATMPEVTLWLMNTGFIGGGARDIKAGNALKIKIPHSSAMLEAMLAGSIKWKKDPDFGYEIVDVDAPENAALVKKVPVEILNPRRFYEKAGRLDDYAAWVKAMKRERRTFLEKYDVGTPILHAVFGAN